METWTVREIWELAQLIVAARDPFIVRRTLTLLQRAEISIAEAIERLKRRQVELV